jgi:hypothetical protein
MQTYNRLETLAPQHQDYVTYQLQNGGLQSSTSPYGLDYCQSIQPGQHYHYHCGYLGCCHPVQPHDNELVVELVDKEIKLNYGARLRALMADPIKGHDLRCALAKVQEALLASVS